VQPAIALLNNEKRLNLSRTFSLTGIFRGFSLKRDASELRWKGEGAKRPVLRVNEHKKDERPQRTGAYRGQKPLVSVKRCKDAIF
jgi:hypothetical protein